uniref:Uncharacterized protein n=1 Tax=Peronospora matthiolae TaxID=2874970 RepID=A0AAV1VF25_9STRA
MDSPQRNLDENDSILDAIENRIFASELGANMHARQMITDALMDSPKQKTAARPPRSRVPALAESVFAVIVPPRG